jgi:hypothetical protein
MHDIGHVDNIVEMSYFLLFWVENSDLNYDRICIDNVIGKDIIACGIGPYTKDLIQVEANL